MSDSSLLGVVDGYCLAARGGRGRHDLMTFVFERMKTLCVPVSFCLIILADLSFGSAGRIWMRVKLGFEE